jgi:hypothetical protein
MFMTLEQEKQYFNDVCDRIIKNPRFYLDNLESLSVFRVSFLDYHDNRYKNRKVYKGTTI